MVYTPSFHSSNTTGFESLQHETLVTRLYVSSLIKQILTFYDNLNSAKKENCILKTFILFFLFHFYSPHSDPDSPHSHPYSPHSHPDSPHSQPDSPHSYPNSRILSPIPRISTPFPHILSQILCIPLILFPDSPFWFLQIAIRIFHIRIY